MKIFSLIAVASIAAAICGAASAQPAPAASAQAVWVRYADLDLNTAAGARNLAFRIHVAANKVCGGEDALLRTRGNIGQCRKAAEERALAGFGAPLLDQALGFSARPIGVANR